MPKFIRYYLTGILFCIAALLLLLIVGCQQPIENNGTKVDTAPTVTLPTGRPVYVVNSKWSIVKSDTITARAIDSTELLQSEVDAYNAAHTDDLLRIYTDEVPAVTEAPDVDIYILNPITWEVNLSEVNYPRALYQQDYALWEYQARGQALFVDHVPPEPIHPWEATPYEYYAFYVLDENGAIVYEDHCGYTSDNVFHQELIYDYPNPDRYFEVTNQMWTIEIGTHPGWRIVTRQLI